MQKFSVLTLIAALFVTTSNANAATWAIGTATTNSWTDPASWVGGNAPSVADPTAVFPVPTAASGTRNMDLNANWTLSSMTIGSATGSSSVTQNIRNSTNGTDVWTLTFDAPGAGPVPINVIGSAATNSRLQSDMFFADNVDVVVDNTVGNGTAGAISLTGNITGPGGLIKDGLGLMTTAFNAGSTTQIKEYTGPTIINNGRWRHSTGGTPTKTSSVTVNNGGQISFLTTGTNTITYGADASVPLNLNGFGPTSGPFAPFPGAIRPDTGLLLTITNRIVLQSDAMIHDQGTSAVITLPGAISGPGRLVIGAIPHDANLGTVLLQGTNTYIGGTTVQAGTLTADSLSTNAFGTGNVQVVSGNAMFAGSQNHLQIDAGATNAIGDTAYLNLSGGNVAGTADDGYVLLGFGVNETVGGLMLGGVVFGPGTYGSSTSSQTPTNPGLANPDEFFTGDGIITVVPAGVPGDYNGNGTVDAADYVLWRKGGSLQNDFTPGNQTSDYDFWRSRFGATTNPGSGSSLTSGTVPEPSSLVLAGIVLAACTAIRRRVD